MASSNYDAYFYSLEDPEFEIPSGLFLTMRNSPNVQFKINYAYQDPNGEIIFICIDKSCRFKHVSINDFLNSSGDQLFIDQSLKESFIEATKQRFPHKYFLQDIFGDSDLYVLKDDILIKININGFVHRYYQIFLDFTYLKDNINMEGSCTINKILDQNGNQKWSDQSIPIIKQSMLIKYGWMGLTLII